jgi:hypothetical protein
MNPDHEKYDLRALCQELNVTVTSERHEDACQKLLQQCLNKKVYQVDKEVDLPGFKNMHACINSISQRPDVAVYTKQVLVLIVEVHSCTKKESFSNTIRKCIMRLIDLLRYYSNFSDNLVIFKGLVSPKLDVLKSAVEVTVEFKSFEFHYSLKYIEKSRFDSTVKSIYSHNYEQVKHLQLVGEHYFPFYIKLPMSMMQRFGENCQQVSSKEAILFKANDSYYKIPVKKDEYMNLSMYSMYSLVAGEDHDIFKSFIRVIKAEAVPGFKYQEVPHGPMGVPEAKQCLGDLVEQIHGALEVLHRAGFLHLDVRLENICFTEDLTVKFIDVDRSVERDAISDDHLFNSCMYDLSLLREKRLDWRQLAVLILWVVTSKKPISSTEYTTAYHQQDPSKIDHPCAKEPFFLTLWYEGKG